MGNCSSNDKRKKYLLKEKSLIDKSCLNKELTISIKKFRFNDNFKKISSLHKANIRKLMYIDNSNYIFSGSEDRTIILRDPHRNQIFAKFQGHTGLILDMLILQDQNSLITCSNDKTIRFWDISFLNNGLKINPDANQIPCKRIIQLKSFKVESFQCILEMPNQQCLISSGEDKSIRFWNLRSPKLPRDNKFVTQIKNSTWCNAMLLIEPNILIVAASCLIRIYNINTKKLCKVLSGHKGMISILKSIGQNKFLSAAGDHTIILWNIYKGAAIQKFTTPWITSMCILSDKIFVTSGYDFDEDNLQFYMIMFWDIGKGVVNVINHYQKINDIISDGDRSLILGGESNELFVLDFK